jgi:hypothetical protein
MSAAIGNYPQVPTCGKFRASAPRGPSKKAQPETVGQAEKWDTDKRKGLAAGLCHACAAQHAWGIQIGFSNSKRPCALCQDVVDKSTGMAKPNGWRRLHAPRRVNFQSG